MVIERFTKPEARDRHAMIGLTGRRISCERGFVREFAISVRELYFRTRVPVSQNSRFEFRDRTINRSVSSELREDNIGSRFRNMENNAVASVCSSRGKTADRRKGLTQSADRFINKHR